MKNIAQTLGAAFVVAALCSGCSARLTMEGARVQVAPAEQAIASCQPISGVEAVASSPEEAEVLLRNKAGTMAATTVYVADRTQFNGKFLLVGKAYTCNR